MKFSIKTLSAAFALTLAAAGSAGATNLCSLHLPGMGCPGASLSGEADSTTHGFVGAQQAPIVAPWLPPPQTDTLAQAMIAFYNGSLPFVRMPPMASGTYYISAAPSMGLQVVYVVTNQSQCSLNDVCTANNYYLLYQASTGAYYWTYWTYT